MISTISWFEIDNIAVPKLIFFGIAASATFVNHSGIKSVLPNCLWQFFIIIDRLLLVFHDVWWEIYLIVFFRYCFPDNFLLVAELFGKALGKRKTCIFVKNIYVEN